MQPRLDFNGAYGWSVRETPNFFESNYKKWSLAVTLKIPVFDGWRTAGKVAQARADRAKVGQDRVALETLIDLEAKQAVDRLRVAASVFRAAELNVAQAQQGARHDRGQLPPRRRHDARRDRRAGRPHPGRVQPRRGAPRPRQRAGRAALRDGPARSLEDRTRRAAAPANEDDRCIGVNARRPACLPQLRCCSRSPPAASAPPPTPPRRRARRPGAHRHRRPPATSTRRSCSPARSSRARRCSWWPRWRRGSSACCATKAPGSRGRDARGARRHRLSPAERPRAGGARRRRGQPRPRARREGARGQPAEDGRHHRQGPPLGAGGAAGGGGLGRPGARRGRDRRAAVRAHAGQGALRRSCRQALGRRRRDARGRHAALHARRRLDPRVRGAGRLARPRQGAARRVRQRQRRGAAGRRHPPGPSRGSLRSSTSARASFEVGGRGARDARTSWAACSRARASRSAPCRARSWSRPLHSCATEATRCARRSSWCARARPSGRRSSLGVEAPDGVQATRGLASGDVVVLDPPATLSSGSPVEPQNGRAVAAAPPRSRGSAPCS